jgi:DNA-directed RNA polymerase specialized sigma24 family protein
MHLTVVEEMTDREIGAALGIEPASVRSHRRRARGQLQGMLAGEADGRTSPGVRR